MTTAISDARLARTQSMSSTTASARRGSIKPQPKRHSAAVTHMRRSASAHTQPQPLQLPPARPPAPPLLFPQAYPLSSAAACRSSFSPSSSPVPRTAASGSSLENLQDCSSSDQVCFDLEYQDEAVAHMLNIEASTNPTLGLMDTQPEVTWTMRPYLIDFMIEMHSTFELRSETLYVAVGILDRYLSKRVVLKRHYQLAGAAAMWIAAKYEDDKDAVPTATELATMCCQSLDESAFHQMESHILATLRYALGRASHETWLRMYFAGDAALLRDRNPVGVPAVARFILHVGLYLRELVPLPPSSVAAGVLWLADLLLSPAGPVASELSRMYDELDAPACEAVAALHCTLRNDDISVVVCQLFPTAHRAVRAVFHKIHRRSSIALLSPRLYIGNSQAVMATPPTRGRGLGSGTASDTSMSPTMALWPTPRTVATAATDEEDLGPYTPVSVFSPLIDCAVRDDEMADTDMSMDVGMGLSPSTFKVEGPHPLTHSTMLRSSRSRPGIDTH